MRTPISFLCSLFSLSIGTIKADIFAVPPITLTGLTGRIRIPRQAGFVPSSDTGPNGITNPLDLSGLTGGTGSVGISGVPDPLDFSGLDALLGIPPKPSTTTTSPECTTTNMFQAAGWETDDKGNVFVGTDEAKLLLISVGSYWPFPKDYRRKRDIPNLNC